MENQPSLKVEIKSEINGDISIAESGKDRNHFSKLMKHKSTVDFFVSSLETRFNLYKVNIFDVAVPDQATNSRFIGASSDGLCPDGYCTVDTWSIQYQNNVDLTVISETDQNGSLEKLIGYISQDNYLRIGF